ncbi:MAG: ribosome rescue protein RqcH [Candidatus Odinarchaeia archaeon]
MPSRKESITNLDTTVLVSELSERLMGSWLNNIYQVNNIFLFKFRTMNGENFTLLVEPGKRIHLTKFIRDKPKTPSPIVMSLRGKIKRTRVSEIKQYDLDRLLYITLVKADEKFTLIFELFSEGNLLLLDDKNRILYATKYRKMRTRDVLPKREYTFPPKRGKNIRELTVEDLKEILSQSTKDLIRSIVLGVSISGEYAEEVLIRAELQPNMKPTELNNKQIEDIFNNLIKMLDDVYGNKLEPRVILDKDGAMITVIPFKFKKYEDFNYKKFKTFNEALDFYFSSLESKTLSTISDKKTDVKFDKLNRIKAEQEKSIKEFREKIKTNKEYGELIYANYHLVDELLKTIQDAKKRNFEWDKIISLLEQGKKKGIPSAVIFEKIIPSQAKLIVKLGSKSVELDFRKTVNENANYYYSLSKKQEKKMKGAIKALELTKKKIEKLEKKVEKEVKKEAIRLSRKKEWYEKFRWFITSDGFIVVGGKDARTNEILVKKYVEKGDKIFHAEIHGAPIVILKTNGKEPPPQSIMEAAQFAASFSRAWQKNVGQLDVYWVESEQISTSPPSGEYLPKGSFYITGTRNYIKNVSLNLSVGIRFKDGFAIPICGPTSAIKKTTDVNVELKFGEITSGKMAKILKEFFIKKVDKKSKKIVANMSLDELQNILPPKGSEIKTEI